MTHDQKFPKRERILKPGEFKQLYREGTKYSVREFLLFVRPTETGPTRLGISVSRKVGNAVTRNRVKRYIRETFRAHKEELLANAAGKYVLICGDNIAGTFDTVNDAVAEGYRQFGNTPFLAKQILAIETPVNFVSSLLEV